METRVPMTKARAGEILYLLALQGLKNAGGVVSPEKEAKMFEDMRGDFAQVNVSHEEAVDLLEFIKNEATQS